MSNFTRFAAPYGFPLLNSNPPPSLLGNQILVVVGATYGNNAAAKSKADWAQVLGSNIKKKPTDCDFTEQGDPNETTTSRIRPERITPGGSLHRKSENLFTSNRESEQESGMNDQQTVRW